MTGNGVNKGKIIQSGAHEKDDFRKRFILELADGGSNKTSRSRQTNWIRILALLTALPLRKGVERDLALRFVNFRQGVLH